MKFCSNCNKNFEQKNGSLCLLFSKPLNSYLCSCRDSLVREPVAEKRPGSPLFCYDERSNTLGLAGIAISSTSAEFSNSLGHFINKEEIGNFGLNMDIQKITIFYKFETVKNWIEQIITNQNPSEPIWRRGHKIIFKEKKHPRNERNIGNSNIHFSVAIEQLVFFLVLIALK